MLHFLGNILLVLPRKTSTRAYPNLLFTDEVMVALSNLTMLNYSDWAAPLNHNLDQEKQRKVDERTDTQSLLSISSGQVSNNVCSVQG